MWDRAYLNRLRKELPEWVEKGWVAPAGEAAILDDAEARLARGLNVIPIALAVILILLYYFCTPPFIGSFYAMPSEGNYLIVNKNLVEAAALLVILALRGGRSYGLDQILQKLFRKPHVEEEAQSA